MSGIEGKGGKGREKGGKFAKGKERWLGVFGEDGVVLVQCELRQVGSLQGLAGGHGGGAKHNQLVVLGWFDSSSEASRIGSLQAISSYGIKPAGRNCKSA